MADPELDKISIECRSCGQEIEKLLDTIRLQVEITCPHCGVPIHLSQNELLRDLKDVEKAWVDAAGGDTLAGPYT
jgi:transcription elongation factor Elf1